ncbi:hypothetical protein GCM10023085_81910 [Actinomadura viridis]
MPAAPRVPDRGTWRDPVCPAEPVGPPEAPAGDYARGEAVSTGPVDHRADAPVGLAAAFPAGRPPIGATDGRTGRGTRELMVTTWRGGSAASGAGGE